MVYTISPGINEQKLNQWLNSAGKKFGHFPDGRINYRDADIAPIVMCLLTVGDKMLLVKRGFGLADAEGYWSIINGFIDEPKPIKEIARQEIKEELGISLNLNHIKVGQSYTVNNPKEKRKYIVFPCLIRLKDMPEISLDKEHTDFAWIKIEDLRSYKILKDLVYAVEKALSLKNL